MWGRLQRWAAVLAVGVGLAGVVAVPAVRAQEPHHGDGPTASTAPADGSTVGLLIADHGEPPEYNQWTYESFREFFQHLIDMGLVPRWLAALETGTILYDADCPACTAASDSPRLIDAWLRPHDGPAVFVPPSDSLPAHYVQPGGPGFGEPDIFEHVGLGAWHEWQRMGGRSPNYDEKLPRKQAVIEQLRAEYGDRLAIRVGYMIDPRFGGGRYGIREALDALVNRDRIESLVVVYHGVGFSDIMQTHHLRHMVHEHLGTLGADIPIRFAASPGTSDHYVAAVVDKVQAELAKVPADAAVAIHLSGHGLPTGTCGEYDCGADAYHRSSADLFARVEPALRRAIDRPGRTGIFHLYGDGAEGDDDPDDVVDSPIEALDERAADGFTHVIDVPYEFDADSRDTLIVLRHGYRREPPDWNAAWESHFTYEGMHVTIANVLGGDDHKIAALHDVTTDALSGWIEPETSVAGSTASHDTGHHAATEARVDADEDHGHVATPARFDEIGTGASHHDGGGPDDAAAHQTAGDVGHDGDAAHHDGELASPTAHRHTGGGASRSTGLVLAVLGGAAIVAAFGVRRRPLAGRAVLLGLGVQLDGLAWDVISHADAGEPVHLLENGGHWLAMVGLAATAVAAVALLRAAGPVPKVQRAVVVG